MLLKVKSRSYLFITVSALSTVPADCGHTVIVLGINAPESMVSVYLVSPSCIQKRGQRLYNVDHYNGQTNRPDTVSLEIEIKTSIIGDCCIGAQKGR